MDDGNYLPFSAFLSGFLLIKKDIDIIDFANEICYFEDETGLCIGGELNGLEKIVKEDKDGFHLIRNYDDKYDENYTVREYLNSMTNNKVKKFFQTEEVNNIEQQESPNTESKDKIIVKSGGGSFMCWPIIRKRARVLR